MILKIAGRGANGRLIAKEIKNVTYVTMAEEQILLYQVDGEDCRQELGGLMWEVCEEEKPEERPVPEKEIYMDAMETEKKHLKPPVLSKKTKAEDNLEEAVKSMSIQLKQNTQKSSADTDEPDDMGKEKTDDVEEMEM